MLAEASGKIYRVGGKAYLPCEEMMNGLQCEAAVARSLFGDVQYAVRLQAAQHAVELPA